MTARRKASKATLIAALRSARRFIAAERKFHFEWSTIPPDRSYDQMSSAERGWIKTFDLVLAKIDAALK